MSTQHIRSPFMAIALLLTLLLVVSGCQASEPAPAGQPTINPRVNTLVLTAGEKMLWNGQAVTQAQLASLLRRTTEMSVEPELQFQTEAKASYDLSARVLQMIKASGVSKFGFVGNEVFAADEKPEPRR